MEKQKVKKEYPRPEVNLKPVIVMFKIEGHETWRTNLFSKKEDFDIYLKKQLGHPKVTERKWFVRDLINGTITEE